MEAKQIYIARRADALSEDQWIPRWRQHGHFVRNLPLWDNFRHYEQCRVLHGDEAGPAAPSVADGYDGVGMVWFRSLEAVETALSDPSVHSIFDDEKETFAAPIADTSVFTREVVLKDTGATRFKWVAFLPRKQGLSREEFQEYWEHRHGPLFLGLPEIEAHVTKYVQNHVIEEYTGAFGDRYDGVVEIGVSSVEGLVAPMTPAAREVLQPDEEQFVDLANMLVVVTDEKVLYEDALGVAAWDPESIPA
jgi:uncharacterized protein (TIGR02118 family)